MRRLLLGLVAVAALAACTDSTPTGTRSPSPNLKVRAEVTPTGTLDQEIKAIIAFWPKGQATAFLSQWETIKKKYGNGSDPKGLQDAIKKLFETSSQVVKLTSKMNPPGTGESPAAAAARLVTYMNLYIFGGPGSTPPPFDPEAESAVGFLTPNQPLTLVTDGGHAGVHFDAGSVNNNRIIVITQDPIHWNGPCDGPLETGLCQYPLYFDIASYPDGSLLKMAQAEVCHPPVGEIGGPPDEATHDRLRLAHTTPDNPANYVPGGIVTGTGDGENIEILPLISQTFLPSCQGTVYSPGEESVGLLQRGVRLASAFASRVIKLVTPKSAYAIDQGGGGGFLDFSPFNNVDADGYVAPTGPTGFTGLTD